MACKPARSMCVLARTLAVLAAVAGLGVAVTSRPVPVARAQDAEASLTRPAHGTRFAFEVIQSHDAMYQGDTPSHLGRDGGLMVRPNVALGDPVYRTVGNTDTRVGRITHVEWSRVSGSLTVEFDPEPTERIAVGDEVWIDLNPRPAG